jgi:hypothetical protein
VDVVTGADRRKESTRSPGVFRIGQTVTVRSPILLRSNIDMPRKGLQP